MLFRNLIFGLFKVMFFLLVFGMFVLLVQVEMVLIVVLYVLLWVVDLQILIVYILCNYGYMVYDMLLVCDSNGILQLQMVSWIVFEDGKIYIFILCDGLKFYDGSDVILVDVVVLLKCWVEVDKIGQVMMILLVDMSEVDVKSFIMSFNELISIVLLVLFKFLGFVFFILFVVVVVLLVSMFIILIIGFGLFWLIFEEFQFGVGVIFEKFVDYILCEELVDGLVGGKVVNFDKVVWILMFDVMMVMIVLMLGEIDFFEQMLYDLLLLVEGNFDIKVVSFVKQGSQNFVWMNYL